ncbi:MAG: DUF1848 domain-containing protein, partial [Asgard group archaeon]|nr:DUF1848 domain-containing protein [Asgard group archaeon]
MKNLKGKNLPIGRFRNNRIYLKSTMNIISASRRTDIPAFYLKWFLNRIKEGFAKYPNPFSKEVYEVSLKPEEVQCVVFWSKAFRLLLPHLDKELKPYNKIFQFTITGHPK